MFIAAQLQSILEKAANRSPLTKAECKYLLSQPANSYASSVIRGAANALIREKNDNAGIIIGQVGVDVHACDAGCKFCSFGKGHTCVPNIRIEKEAMRAAIEGFRRNDDLYGMYLMTMADTKPDVILDYVSYARSVIPETTQIWVNTGDHDRAFYEELADNIFLCIGLGVTQFGAMRRIAVPGSPLYHYGQISDLEMAHVMGCVGLVYASVDSCRFFGVHEPCQLGYLSGANFVTAETGANPRDTAQDTSKGRGWDMERCRKLLFECGFTSLLRGNETRVKLDYDYLVKTDSLL